MKKNKKSRNKFITPMYDPIQDKIFGCKEGTLVYYHEEGHRRYLKKGYAGWSGNNMIWAIIFSIQFLIAKWYLLAQIALFVSVSLIFFEEIYCWVFAFKKKSVYPKHKIETVKRRRK